MRLERRTSALGFLTILLALIIVGYINISCYSLGRILTNVQVTLKSEKVPVMLDHVEMKRIMYDDVSGVTDGVLSSSDPRYMNLIYSRLSTPNTKLPRMLAPYENKTLRHGGGQTETVIQRLKDRRNGFFIECGAYDGQTYSNSLFLEVERGWTGLLIEPQPGLYRALLGKNRRAYTLNACISTTRRPKQELFKLAGMAGGIVNKSLDQLTKEEKAITIPVMCFPFNDVMAAINVTHIDFLNLDIEGPEVEVLDSIDWKKITIDIMTVEFHHQQPKLKRLRELMKRIGGYREVGIVGVDVMFEREDVK